MIACPGWDLEAHRWSEAPRLGRCLALSRSHPVLDRLQSQACIMRIHRAKCLPSNLRGGSDRCKNEKEVRIVHYSMPSMNMYGHDLLEERSDRSPFLTRLNYYSRGDGCYFCCSAEHSLCLLITVSMLLNFAL